MSFGKGQMWWLPFVSLKPSSASVCRSWRCLCKLPTLSRALSWKASLIFFYWIVAILSVPHNPLKQALWGPQSNWQCATFKALLYLTFPYWPEEGPALPTKGLSRGCWASLRLALCHDLVSALFALFLWYMRWDFSSILISKLERWPQSRWDK